MTHDEIVKMMLLDGSGHRTIDAVSVAVKERDELRKTLPCDDSGQTQVVVDANWINELVAERDELRKTCAKQSLELAEQSIHLSVFNEVAQERDAAREALAAILLHIDPYEDSLQATIAALIEQGMG